MSYADARTRLGKYHVLPAGAGRTLCGRVPTWNWFTCTSANGATCKACIKVHDKAAHIAAQSREVMSKLAQRVWAETGIPQVVRVDGSGIVAAAFNCATCGPGELASCGWCYRLGTDGRKTIAAALFHGPNDAGARTTETPVILAQRGSQAVSAPGTDGPARFRASRGKRKPSNHRRGW